MTPVVVTVLDVHRSHVSDARCSEVPDTDGLELTIFGHFLTKHIFILFAQRERERGGGGRERVGS